MKEVTFFVKSFMALVKGDDVEVQALKVQRKVEAALKAQIAVKEGQTVNLEDALEEAKERLSKSVLNNGKTEDFNNENYISQLLSSKNNLTEAEEDLEAHVATVAFLKETLEKVKG